MTEEIHQKLQTYYQQYQTVRLRIIRCRNGQARMRKCKNVEHEEAYTVELQHHMFVLRNLHGNIRLLRDIVGGLDKTA